MKFQFIVFLISFCSQMTFGYTDIYAADAVTNPPQQNSVAQTVAQSYDEQTELAYRVSKEVNKGYERLMSEARRITRSGQTTYIVAIEENHPKVIEARLDLAKNGTSTFRSGVIVPSRHIVTMAGLHLAQLAIANITAEIENRIQNSANNWKILSQLNSAFYLEKTMLP